MTTLRNPLNSLSLGQWFKLICGASYQDVAAVRNLSLIYSLAGADCIDVAADLAVVHAAR
ncbi:MAG: 4Fe-4S ferredoxin, partial [Cyanobacteria bacterium P01_F01_bin.86]